jgi:hypothetical protein
MNWNRLVDALGRVKRDIDRRRDLRAAGMDSPWVMGPAAPGVFIRLRGRDGEYTAHEVVDIEFDDYDVVIDAREGLPPDWRDR